MIEDIKPPAGTVRELISTFNKDVRGALSFPDGIWLAESVSSDNGHLTQAVRITENGIDHRFKAAQGDYRIRILIERAR